MNDPRPHDDDLGRTAARRFLDAAHRGAGYAPIRHATLGSDNQIVPSTANHQRRQFIGQCRRERHRAPLAGLGGPPHQGPALGD